MIRRAGVEREFQGKQAYLVTLVLGRPTGDLPSSHLPLSLRALTRSKRFITERVPDALPLALRLECLDIKFELVDSWGRKLGGSSEICNTNFCFFLY